MLAVRNRRSAVVVRISRLAAVALCVFLPAGDICAQPLRTAPTVKPEILRAIWHDPTAYTQGLICVDTVIYESTGLVGRSSLRRVGAPSGKILQNIPVPGVFAEGIAIFKGELVQLTWQDRAALRYEYPSLNPKVPAYRYNGEGWGLTNDSTHFIMSDGSDTLYFRDANFQIARKVPVTLDGKPLKHLNELEYARGYVYANVWHRDFIVEINKADGRVTRIIDCSELAKIEMPRTRDDVLNGIAYCDKNDEWILTGKNWRNMFAVKIPKP